MTSTVGRLVVDVQTNKSGGAVAYGDVVINDGSNAHAFTTTTTGGFTAGAVGVCVEPNGIASNATGRIQYQGYCAQVNTNASVTNGYFLKTHTVAKQATGSATRVVGSFGVAMSTATNPAALLWGLPDASSATGNVATDPIWDAAGDLAVGTGADTAARLAVGSMGQFLGGGTTAAWLSLIPPISNFGDHYSSGASTCAVTVSAPAIGANLICVVCATGRGADSITQTNVTWTKRYSGNGNSQYFEVWTGVCAGGSGGTTATVNFTGNNQQECSVFTWPGPANFTSVTGVATATSAGATLLNCSGSVTRGNYVIVGATSTAASSYSGLHHPYAPGNAFGGQSRFAVLQAWHDYIAWWSVSPSSTPYFAALVTLA